MIHLALQRSFHARFTCFKIPSLLIVGGLCCSKLLSENKHPVVQPVKQISKPTNQNLSISLWNHLKHEKLLLSTIIILSCTTAAVNVYTPIMMGSLVAIIQELLQNNTGFHALNLAALKLFGLIISQGILTFVDISLVSQLGENLAKRMRLQLYSSLLSKDVSFFDSKMHGQIVSRLAVDISDFKHTFKLVVTQGLKCTTQIIGSAISLFTISPTLSLGLVSSMPFLYFFMNGYGIFLRTLSKEAKGVESDSTSIATEAISNIKTVKAFVCENSELERYSNSIQESSFLNCNLGFHIGLFQGLTNISIGSLALIIMYYGGKLVTQGSMSAGDLMAYMYATQNTQKSLSLVGVLFGQVIKAHGSAARVFEYIDDDSQRISFGTKQIDSFQGRIEFKDVDFTYPSRPDHTVLKDFSLEIPSGKVVALCGQSGSGKSTIGQLIEGFYLVDSGKLLVDGVDINEIDPFWLRRHIGYINQEPVLFATSILENIRYGKPDATMEEVIQAARKANAHGFIMGFPHKYDTKVGERGMSLSGGQKQRIAIARALLKDPKLLILDEATSALDTESEALVQQALDELMVNRTVLIIAHRLSTISSADIVVVMGPGKNILEMGSPAELLAKKGAFFKLYNS